MCADIMNWKIWSVSTTLALLAFGCPRPELGGEDAAWSDLEDTESVPLEESSDAGSDASETGGEDASSNESGEIEPIAPCLINAFSAAEGTISAHFSKPMDPATATDVANYSVYGSSGDTIEIVGAVLEGNYVRLQLDPGTTFIANTDYSMLVQGLKDLSGLPIDDSCKKVEKIKRTLFLNLIWHQHQPLYLEPVRDQLLSPWVRKHATKDYYDMASILVGFPKVHYNVNLTSVLLNQLIRYYLERLGPYVDIQNNWVDESAFLAAWKGKTDPWIDLLLDDTPTLDKITEQQIGLLYKDAWSCVSTSDALMKRFPQYRTLRDKPRSEYTQEDFLQLKGWFEIAWFDPDFLNSAVLLPNGWVVDLTDVVKHESDGTYTLRQPITEELCNRLVAEEYKIMANVIPIHKQLLFNPDTHTGQIEVLTTPFYHPILPLLVDTDLARENQPRDSLPEPPFRFEQDAFAQVAKAVKFYQEIFGIHPAGMWPGEGSVAEAVVPIFVQNGIQWMATGQEVLNNSQPKNLRHWFPYRVDANDGGGSGTNEMAIVFRDTGISNAIGFKYQSMLPDEAAASFMGDVLAQAPSLGSPDRLLTVIMDGENAWEGYVHDHDAKNFLRKLYESMESAYDAGEVISVTGSEYIRGNSTRSVPAHPIGGMTKIEPLSAGSWIDGTFGVWVGEPEENVAWACLLRARQDLERSGVPRPNPLADPPENQGSDAYKIYMAWEEVYAAEGSDWFWWFGQDMITPANDDTPFDRGFRAHLSGVYAFLRQVDPDIAEYVCPVIIQESGKTPQGPFTQPPTIDGKFVPNEAEWINEGGFFNDSDSGAVANPDDHLAKVYYGYDSQDIYLAVDSNLDLSTGQRADHLEVYFTHKHIVNVDTGETQSDPANPQTRNGTPLQFKRGGAARVLIIDLLGASPSKILEADGVGGWNEQPEVGSLEVSGPIAPPNGSGKVVEIRVAFEALNLSAGDPLEVILLSAKQTVDVDLAPNMGSQVVFEDASNAVKVMFVVDVSGSQIPRDAYGSCCTTPPPPDGEGIVYIAGNLPQLGAEGDKWIPNDTPLRDDGQKGDEAVSDQQWTLIIDAQRNESIKYKYTIGTNQDRGRWYGTEEFPVTYRGIEVVGADPTKELQMLIVRDVFADKPQGGRDGYPGSMTEFEYVYKE